MFLYCNINICDRFTIVITVINLGLILCGIAQFKLIGDGSAWKVDGRAQALVGPGLATPLVTLVLSSTLYSCYNKDILLVVGLSYNLASYITYIH